MQSQRSIYHLGSGLFSERTKQLCVHAANHGRKIDVSVSCPLLMCCLFTGVDAVKVRNEVNSVGRVVNLLQDMSVTITVEGKQVHNFRMLQQNDELRIENTPWFGWRTGSKRVSHESCAEAQEAFARELWMARLLLTSML